MSAHFEVYCAENRDEAIREFATARTMVANEFIAARRLSGATVVAGVDCSFYFGSIDYAKARRSMDLFASEVIPQLKHQPEPALA